MKATLRQVCGIALCAASLVAWSAPTDAPVADAAMRGDLDAVRALLRQGADVNAAHGDGMTALHWAAERGDVRLLDVLIRAGARVDAVTRIGDYTPLHLASRAARSTVVVRLLKAGADPMARTATGGATPLHFAAGAGDADAIAALLDRGADVDVRETTWGQTPLVWAAARNRLAAVRLLSKRGADPSVTTNVVDLPARAEADRAAEKTRNEVLATLRKAEGDSPTWRPDPAQVQSAVRAAQRAQDVASSDEEKTVDFEEHRLGPLSYAQLVGTHGGLTPLLHAVREGHRDVALALLEAGADIRQASAGEHTSPLLMAVINGHFDLALELLRRGADPKRASAAGTTPLYGVINTQWAPKARYPQQLAYEQQQATYLELMTALLEAGADPNVRLLRHLWYMSYTFDLLGVDTKGATPFWRAAYALDIEAMKMLVAYGADPTIPTQKVPERRYRRARDNAEEEKPDPSGLPPVPVDGPAVHPIHAASGVGYGEGFAANAHRHAPDAWLPAVRYLVEELGADVNARDHNGYAPLHHAAARGDNELIRYLVERGADVTAVSRAGQTTADMANGPVQRVQPFPETVALLESLGSKNNHNCVSC